MNLFGKILVGGIGSILLYAAGVEVEQAPKPVKVPPGATLVAFSDLGGRDLPLHPDQAQPGDYVKHLAPSVRRLDHRRVVIQGFMIPTRSENRNVRSFLLVRSQASCCFGMPPQLSDVLEVTMAGKPVEPMMDRPVNVVGQFHVQEHWAGRYLGSLYQLDGESVAPANDQPPLKLTRSPQAAGLE